MPRLPIRSPLPSLKKESPFQGFIATQGKAAQIANALRRLIHRHRSTQNVTFYSTRELAGHFGVSLSCVLQAIRQLEEEGLLQRLRGSETKMVGIEAISNAHIQAVVGFPLWMFGLRYLYASKMVPLVLGDQLWPHHIAFDPIIYLETEDEHSRFFGEFNDRLLRRQMDFTLWLLPFAQHRDAILSLKDRGVRSLIISEKAVASEMEPHVRIDYQTGYATVLEDWRSQWKIRKLLIVQSSTYPRGRDIGFATLAREWGFECEVVQTDRNLAGQLNRQLKERVGLVVLDEHSTVEFTHLDPAGFLKLARKHRVFFGEGDIHLPFLDGMLRVERTFIRPDYLAPLVVDLLVRWRLGETHTPQLTLPTSCDLDWPVIPHL